MGTGVVPDVPVPAGDALRVAHLSALGELIAKTSDAAWRERLVKEQKALEEPARR